jgi:hypothetical protein
VLALLLAGKRNVTASPGQRFVSPSCHHSPHEFIFSIDAFWDPFNHKVAEFVAGPFILIIIHHLLMAPQSILAIGWRFAGTSLQAIGNMYSEEVEVKEGVLLGLLQLSGIILSMYYIMKFSWLTHSFFQRMSLRTNLHTEYFFIMKDIDFS